MGREGTRAPWPPLGSAVAAGAAGAAEEDALSFPREAVPRSCHSSAPAQLQSQMCPLGMVIAEQGRWETGRSVSLSAGGCGLGNGSLCSSHTTLSCCRSAPEAQCSQYRF